MLPAIFCLSFDFYLFWRWILFFGIARLIGKIMIETLIPWLAVTQAWSALRIAAMFLCKKQLARQKYTA
jgi:hypothetical protein